MIHILQEHLTLHLQASHQIGYWDMKGKKRCEVTDMEN